MRKAREQELKHLRDFGVCEKVDEREAIAHYQVTPVDTRWIDTDKAFEGGPMQIRSWIVAREFTSDEWTDLNAGTPPMEALKSIIFMAANHKEAFSVMHVDVSRAYFHVKAQRRGGTITSGGQNGHRCWKIGLLKKSMYGTRDAASNWERDWPKHIKTVEYQLGISLNNLFRQEGDRVSGMTHGDDFVLTGPTERLTVFENNDRGVSSRGKLHQLRIIREHQRVEQKVALVIGRNRVPA